MFILRQNPVPREVIDNSFHLSVLIKRHKDGRTAPRIPAIRLRSLLRQGAPKDDGPINKLENQARLGIKDLATRNDELRKTIAELKTHIRNTTYFVETAAKIAK